MLSRVLLFSKVLKNYKYIKKEGTRSQYFVTIVKNTQNTFCHIKAARKNYNYLILKTLKT